MIIQVVIIIVALWILTFGLRGRQTHVGRAWKKLALLFLVIAMVVAVLFPDSTNDLAHFVGVGRGADLLLYVVTLAFIMNVLNSYLQQQVEKDNLFRLARKLALFEAKERYKIK